MSWFVPSQYLAQSTTEYDSTLYGGDNGTPYGRGAYNNGAFSVGEASAAETPGQEPAPGKTVQPVSSQTATISYPSGIWVATGVSGVLLLFLALVLAIKSWKRQHLN